MIEQTPVAERTLLEKFVLGLIALSAVGFVVSMVGHLADWKGFDNGGESTVAGSTFWFLYFFAGIAAVVAGVLALVHGTRAKIAGERRAGLLALGYAVVTVVLIVLAD